MKKFKFSLVVILTMIFSSSISAQFVNRSEAIDRLQAEIVEITADPTYGLVSTSATSVGKESAMPFSKMLVANRRAYHKTVLENLLVDSQLNTAGALDMAQEQYASQHGMTTDVIAELHQDVADLLN